MITLLAALLLSPTAEAGCAVDTEREARQASAGLVLRGEVVSIEVTEEQGQRVVRERVRVTEALKGEVRQGGLLLRGALPTGGCPPSALFPVGAEVYLIGNPGPEGELSISPCTDDVGLAAARSDLEALARKKRSQGVSVEGVSPTPPGPLLVLTSPPSEARVQVRAQGRWIEAALISHAEAVVFVQAELEGFTLQRAVDPKELRPLVREDTALSEDLTLIAGAPMTLQGQPDWFGGWALEARLPEGTIADHALPSAYRERPPSGAAVLKASEPLTLYTGPDSDAAALIMPRGGGQLHATGLELSGWTQVHVDARWVKGEAWVKSEAVRPAGPEGVVGGVVGGVLGGVSSHAPLKVTVPARTPLLQPGTGAVLGEVGRRPLDLLWLADGAEARSVLLETPWGPVVAEVPLDDEGTCE